MRMAVMRTPAAILLIVVRSYRMPICIPLLHKLRMTVVVLLVVLPVLRLHNALHGYIEAHTEILYLLLS